MLSREASSAMMNRILGRSAACSAFAETTASSRVTSGDFMDRGPGWKDAGVANLPSLANFGCRFADEVRCRRESHLFSSHAPEQFSRGWASPIAASRDGKTMGSRSQQRSTPVKTQVSLIKAKESNSSDPLSRAERQDLREARKQRREQEQIQKGNR